MKRVMLVVALGMILAGCGTSPVLSESTREVVLQYLGGDVGTVGPMGQSGKKELDILSDTDRKKAESLMDRGAALFLVYGATPDNPAGRSTGPNRVVLVQNRQVVGDFPVQRR